jgi:hypothetical protein
MSGNWIIPFRGRGSSGAVHQNFLWRDNNIYLMDNHRAALWCWLQEITFDNDKILIHVDYHTDFMSGGLTEWCKSINKPISQMSIDEYLDLKYIPHEKLPGQEYHTFRWDNYLSIFLSLYHSHIKTIEYAIVEGEKIVCQNLVDHECSELKPYNLPDMIKWRYDTEGIILNVDLDYFVYKTNDGDCDLLYSTKYIESFFESVKFQLDSQRVEVLTIALSPETSGGWEKAEYLCEIACDKLELDFKL